jgi:hypothetical protein
MERPTTNSFNGEGSKPPSGSEPQSNAAPGCVRLRTLSPRDSAMLLNMLANPVGPNDALIQAAERHKAYFGNS